MYVDENKIVFDTIRNVANFYTSGEHGADAEWGITNFNSLINEVVLKNLQSIHYDDICKVILNEGLFLRFCTFSKQEAYEVEKNYQKTVKFLYSHISDNTIFDQNGVKMNLKARLPLLNLIKDALCALHDRLSTRYKVLNEGHTKLENENDDLIRANKKWKVCTGLLFLTTVSLSLYIILCKAKT
jgi:hypothetical protein